jgi:hypothetical protein
MLTTKTAAAAAIRKARTWIKGVDWNKGRLESTQNHAVNVVTGAFRVLLGCGVDVKSWIVRDGDLVVLMKPMVAVRSEAGREAIARLLMLADMALESRSWETSKIEVGPLPDAEARTISADRVAAMQAGREKTRENQRSELEKIKGRRREFDEKRSRTAQRSTSQQTAENDPKTLGKNEAFWGPSEQQENESEWNGTRQL